MRPAPVDLSVIIVNYNGAAFIQNCLDTLFASKVTFSFDVVIIDNASTDNSLELLKAYPQPIHLMENSVNAGFAQGNNQAIHFCNGSSVFLLNNDTVLFENTLQSLWDFHQAHIDAVITPKLLNEDGSLQAPGSSFGHFRFKAKVPTQVPFIAGAAVMMTKERYWSMNGMDENLFFYNDDIDMCKLLKKMKVPIYYVPTSEIIHIGGLSTKFRRVGSLIEGYRGGIYLSNKHYGPVASLLYRLLLALLLIIKLIPTCIVGIFSAHYRAFIGGYLYIFKINLTNEVKMPSRQSHVTITTAEGQVSETSYP